MDDANDEVKRTVVEIEGEAKVVDTIVTLLRFIEACGTIGTTRDVELMIDGDGNARIAVRIDGQERPLEPVEEAFLFEGEGPGTDDLRAQYIEHGIRDDEPILKIDLA